MVCNTSFAEQFIGSLCCKTIDGDPILPGILVSIDEKNKIAKIGLHYYELTSEIDAFKLFANNELFIRTVYINRITGLYHESTRWKLTSGLGEEKIKQAVCKKAKAKF